MTSLKQDQAFNWPVSVSEAVTVAPENQDQNYAKWLVEQVATSRFCQHHPQTKLVLGANQPRHPLFGPFLSEGEIEFRATFFCPSCRRAYAMFPQEFIHSSFETFVTDTKERIAAVAMARTYVDHVNQFGDGFLVFVGMPGTGKTRLAAGIVGELRGLSGLYIRQSELLVALRSIYGWSRVESDADDVQHRRASPLQITQAAGLLVLDEIGATAFANDERMLIDELLKHRYEQHKPTILISNLPLNQLYDYLGDALADRVGHATGNGKFIFKFTGESYRRISGHNYLSSRQQA